MPRKPKPSQRPWLPTRADNSRMQRRAASRAEYHTSRWTRESRLWREEHPLCEECKRRGLIKPAEVVDHIIPAEVCTDFWDRSNWQSLCKDCNIAKGNRDKKLIHGKSGKCHY